MSVCVRSCVDRAKDETLCRAAGFSELVQKTPVKDGLAVLL